MMGVSAATISRELKRGRVVLRDYHWREYESYSADVAQDDYDQKATNKGPDLKIGRDYALAEHIEKRSLKRSILQTLESWKLKRIKRAKSRFI